MEMTTDDARTFSSLCERKGSIQKTRVELLERVKAATATIDELKARDPYSVASQSVVKSKTQEIEDTQTQIARLDGELRDVEGEIKKYG